MPLEQFRGFPRDKVVQTRPSTQAQVAGATACLIGRAVISTWPGPSGSQWRMPVGINASLLSL